MRRMPTYGSTAKPRKAMTTPDRDFDQTLGAPRVQLDSLGGAVVGTKLAAYMTEVRLFTALCLFKSG